MKLEDKAELQAMIDAEHSDAEAAIERVAEKYMLKIIDLRRENESLKKQVAALFIAVGETFAGARNDMLTDEQMKVLQDRYCPKGIKAGDEMIAAITETCVGLVG